jgi:hypothetical protein
MLGGGVGLNLGKDKAKQMIQVRGQMRHKHIEML